MSCGDHVTAVSWRRQSYRPAPGRISEPGFVPHPPTPGRARPTDAELSLEMVQCMHSHVASRYKRTQQQELARVELLRQSFPTSTTKIELAAVRELAAHERSAGLIAQLHEQASAAADDALARQLALKARFYEDARRRKVVAWLLAGLIAARSAVLS